MTGLFQVRFHGRGGQGVVTAAELLSVAAFLEGREAQAFPAFGSERMGAPVASYCRIADVAIRTRAPVDAPDAVIVSDPTLVHHVDILGGLGPDGYLLVNTTLSVAELGLAPLPRWAATVPATDLARTHLGRPLPAAPLLGALAALTGVVSLESVTAALEQRFSGLVAQGNVAGAVAGFDAVMSQLEKEMSG